MIVGGRHGAVKAPSGPWGAVRNKNRPVRSGAARRAGRCAVQPRSVMRMTGDKRTKSSSARFMSMRDDEIEMKSDEREDCAASHPFFERKQ